MYFAELKGMKKEEADEAIKNWAKKLKVEEYLDKPAEKLSKGNQQKIQFMNAIIHNPELVVLDEPFSGLDPVNTEILKNAIEAIDKIGGRLNIATKNKSGGLQIKITDNGIGIDEKNMKKIFDPFFSSKGAPGLGLSIAKKILKEHSGEISIKSELNKGTEVRILLNIYEEE